MKAPIATCLLTLILTVSMAWGQSLGKPDTDLPLRLMLKSRDAIFSRHQAIRIHCILKALRPVTVCMPRNPIQQFSFEVFRSGQGKLMIQPQVSQDTSLLSESRRMNRVALRSGQQVTVPLNLKILQNNIWEAGEYRVRANFYLCQPDSNHDRSIPSSNRLSFLILNQLS
jgi:hypothetical protein